MNITSHGAVALMSYIQRCGTFAPTTLAESTAMQEPLSVLAGIAQGDLQCVVTPVLPATEATTVSERANDG